MPDRGNDNEPGGSLLGQHNISYSVNYDILMPDTAPLSIKNRFGAVTVSHLNANADINNANGKLLFSDGRGTQRLENSFGGVEVTRNVGEVIVNNANGYVTATRVDATTIKGNASVRSSFSPIILKGISGSIEVDNQNGSGEVSDVTAGAPGAPRCHNIRLSTTFSQLRITLPENASFKVEARTSFGKVSSELPLSSSGNLSESSVTGKMGNAECELKLTNSNGNIQILKTAGK